MLIKDTTSDDFLAKDFSLTVSNIGALCTLTKTLKHKYLIYHWDINL